MVAPYQVFYDCPTCGVGRPLPKVTDVRKLAWVCDVCNDCVAVTEAKPSNEVSSEVNLASTIIGGRPS